MDEPLDIIPFRWDLTRREQLGRLLEESPGPVDSYYDQRLWPEFLEELRSLAVRVVAMAGDARLVFVGRSPESVYDYLTGVLADTEWRDRCALLSISLGDRKPETPAALALFRAHLRALGLAPAQIASAPRPIALVDLIWQGRTFAALSEQLAEWAREEEVDVRAVRRRMRFVGITTRTKNSPKTWRWFQQHEWTRDYPRSALRGVSVPYWMWTYLGDSQHKTMLSNRPDRWGTEDMRIPSRDTGTLVALRNAYRIHELGRTPDERARFAAELTARVEMREPWLRSLVVGIRK